MVLDALDRNERGDAELFIYLHKDKYVFDSSEGKNGAFYVWNGTHWEIDFARQRYQDMKEVEKLYEWAASYVNEANTINAIKKRASTLRTAKRYSAVFTFISTEVSFKGTWDHCPGFLPCSNGLVDLKTGDILPHLPARYLRTVCPTPYIPIANSALFDKFIQDITLEDEELMDFLACCLGSALLGDAKEEKVFFLYGAQGRNGKGTLLQALERVLGKLARTFPSEMLLLQKNTQNSNSPSPELANLQGVRFAIFSEINKGKTIDAAKVKNYSGRDTIPCRRLYSNVDLAIKPSHTMFIQTNYKPEAPADDQALWSRTYLIPFNAHFVAEPKDPHERLLDPGFKEKLFKETESILAWLVLGCIKYQTDGLLIPSIVLQETENYRKENDVIGHFLDEKCILDAAFSTQKNKMRQALEKFCDSNGYAKPNKNEMANYLIHKFGEEVDGRTGQYRLWKGIKLLNDENDAMGYQK